MAEVEATGEHDDSHGRNKQRKDNNVNGKTKWLISITGFLFTGLIWSVSSAHVNIDTSVRENNADHVAIRREILKGDQRVEGKIDLLISKVSDICERTARIEAKIDD